VNERWIVETCGFSELSGTFRKAMNYGPIKALGVFPKKKESAMVLAGWVKKKELWIGQGLKEKVYWITDAGETALKEYLSVNGPLPELKGKDECTNWRYKGD
jgi:hypothetical protein